MRDLVVATVRLEVGSGSIHWGATSKAAWASLGLGEFHSGTYLRGGPTPGGGGDSEVVLTAVEALGHYLRRVSASRAVSGPLLDL